MSEKIKVEYKFLYMADAPELANEILGITKEMATIVTVSRVSPFKNPDPFGVHVADWLIVYRMGGGE